jgi:hypothetical protein
MRALFYFTLRLKPKAYPEGNIYCISSSGISGFVPGRSSHSFINAGTHGSHPMIMRIFSLVWKYSSKNAFIFHSVSASLSKRGILHSNSSIPLYPENRLIRSIKRRSVLEDGV